MGVFKYNLADFLFTCMGLLFLLLDIGLDIYAAVSFYQEKSYAHLGILLLLLVGSSVLVQAFSWLWYRYENFNMETTVERRLGPNQLLLLHVLQLGIYVRHASVVEVSVLSFFPDKRDNEGVAVFLSHDLSMLRLIETFSESAPQFVLMLTIILQQGRIDSVTVLKAVGSALAITFSVTTYHRSLRSFLPDKEKQPLVSSLVYFLWNLLLISSRLTALALFASVLPCFIFVHVFSAWLFLFFCAWRSQTDFMDSACGERLYRATVGLIWYFTWFNVVEGKTRYRTLLYHVLILADISVLCSLWCWMMHSTEQTPLGVSHFSAVVTAICVVAVYILGLVCKMIYYKFFHPNVAREELEGGTAEDETDFPLEMSSRSTPESLIVTSNMDTGPQFRSLPSPTRRDAKRCNKRMKKLAENFYS